MGKHGKPVAIEEEPLEQEEPNAEPKPQGLLDDIVAFIQLKGGKASKVDILAEFEKAGHEQVNFLLTSKDEIFVPSREAEVKYYSLK